MADLQPISYACWIGGRAVDPSLIRWRRDEAEYLIEIELQLPDYGEWSQCRVGESILIEITDVIELHGTVEALPWSASEGGTDYMVRGASPALALEEVSLVEDFAAGDAEAIATALAARYGVTLDWQLIPGWPIRSGALAASHESPLEVLRRMAEAAGGIIESKPDGSLLMRPLYPVSLPNWLAATPALLVSDEDFAISASSDMTYQTRYNAFLIGEQAGAARDGVTIEEGEALSSTRREVFVYCVPWTFRYTLQFVHTGGPWVAIEAMGEVEELIVDEEVEFVGGKTSLSKPCYGITSAVWREVSLGAVIAAEDGSLSAAVEGESLLKVSYNTRYLKYILTNPQPNTVQVVADEVI